MAMPFEVNGHKMACEVKVCETGDIFDIVDTDPSKPTTDEDVAQMETTKKELNNYLKAFCAPVHKGEGEQRNQLCPKCGRPFGGMLSWLGHPDYTSIQWGLVHGEGNCTTCHWPYRGHHHAKGEDGELLFEASNLFLAYHPGVVNKKDTPDV